jgi:hypothetical protein
MTRSGDRDRTRNRKETIVSIATTATHPESRSGPLSRWLLLDAAMSGSAGVALAAGGAWLNGVLGAPAAFLIPVGVFLVAYAGFLVLLTRIGAPTPAVWLVIVGNAAWAVASVAVVLADWLTLTTAGNVLTLAQAVAVALFAELQFTALRKRAS